MSLAAQPATVQARLKSHWLRDLIACVSLANICYLKSWSAVLDPNGSVRPVAYAGLIINVLGLAASFWVGVTWARHSRHKGAMLLARSSLAACVVVFLHGINTIYFEDYPRIRNLLYLAALSAAVIVILSPRVFRFLSRSLLCFAPFVLVTFSQAAWKAATYRTPRPFSMLAPRLPAGAAARRAVWIIFDEWDAALTFDDRKPNLRLPVLDDFGKRAVVGSRVYPPGSVTEKSIPRLITGRPGANVNTLGDGPNVFSRAREAGFNTAAAGWFLPYCVTLGRSLADCWTCRFDPDRISMGRDFLRVTLNQTRNLFENQFRSPFGQSLGTERQALDYTTVLTAAKRMAADPGLGLVFVHIPMPHEPLFYNARTGTFDFHDPWIISFFRKDFSRYLDALQLVDRTVGELITVMKDARVWDRTCLLLSSDHPYRNRSKVDGKPIDRRVPFLLKLPGEADGVRYEPVFNSILSQEILLAVLQGRMSSPSQVAQWLDRHRGDRASR